MGKLKQIISASRRTDIPGWYTSWFMDRIRCGHFIVTNPFNRRERRVEATPDTVHTIVFWSKNIGPLVDGNAHRVLTDMGFHLYFNLTVNPDASLLEPGIPELTVRLTHLRKLCRDLDPAQVTWRFDPICTYRQNEVVRTNASGFIPIADAMGDLGIRRCVTSFYDPYPKVNRRIHRMVNAGKPEIEFIEPGVDDRVATLREMALELNARGISLALCCEKELIERLSGQLLASPEIRPNACIDGRRYKRLFGGAPETARDYGQRREKGCRCTRSVDIGSYDQHPCRHNCLFCYARTGSDMDME